MNITRVRLGTWAIGGPRWAFGWGGREEAWHGIRSYSRQIGSAGDEVCRPRRMDQRQPQP